MSSTMFSTLIVTFGVTSAMVSCVETEEEFGDVEEVLVDAEDKHAEAYADVPFVEISGASDATNGPSVKSFWISNPYGESYAVRLTATIPSGSGKIAGMNFYNQEPSFDYMYPSCSGTTLCKKILSFDSGCKNYGTAIVDVSYTGSVAPKLQYWYYDC